jgi:hypothetical protein
MSNPMAGAAMESVSVRVIRSPLSVENKSSNALGSGVFVPIPTLLFWANDSWFAIKHNIRGNTQEIKANLKSCIDQKCRIFIWITPLY